METIRTVVCKLAPTPEQASEMDATLGAFAAACDCAAAVARRIGSTNKVKVQHAAYRDLRARFGLAANLAIRAIARACAALKVPARRHAKFAPTSIDYDARIFRFREWDWTFSLTLLHSRQRIATILGERQKSLLKGRKPTSATLVKRRHGGYFLHVPIADENPDPIEPQGSSGVALGVKNRATTDDGATFSGADGEARRRRHHRIRKTCQRTGTRRARRKLPKARRREARFRANQTPSSAHDSAPRPKTPALRSPAKTSRESPAGPRLAWPSGVGSRAGRSPHSARSSPPRRPAPASRSFRWTLATPRVRAPSAGLARRGTGSLGTNSKADIGGSSSMPLGTPPAPSVTGRQSGRLLSRSLTPGFVTSEETPGKPPHFPT